MDDEIRDALKMTKEELLALAAEGKPARVARSVPPRLRKKRGLNVSKIGPIRMELDVSSIVIERGHLDEHRAVKVKPFPVTIRR